MMWAERRLAILFGFLGLVPFLAGTVCLWWWPAQELVIASGYFLFSAGVLAFMAGVYWPISMHLNHYAYPVSPMTAILLSQGFFILAGAGLVLPLAYRPVLFAAAYSLLYATDAILLRKFWPRWYMQLRLQLTIAVVGTQFIVGYLLWSRAL